ncbi:Ser/Thr protein phosphatase [Tritrichomonas foetus]|uniref:protein-serine/threonine phosphatase n=1 Tax=Tritrichomonas foetus TaxID=1144522 RepID=A0A1J4KYM9_9EUKA|nr:Ser/Thr protein phosphatase [Tritrichomonas foetus]|eukprot:OHT16351.1 Ser/Thr protein phosphatase [Tritrichomonas foetus]
MQTAASQVMSKFSTLLMLSKTRNNCVGTSVPIPRFEEPLIRQLLKETITLLKERSIIQQIDPPVYVIGELSGNLIDLMRIFAHSESVDSHCFVFLGNYSGCRSFSAETIIFLLSLYCCYPQTVCLLRGKNEFLTSESFKNLSNEFLSLKLNLVHELTEVFGYFPLACVISKEILCIHSGIGKNFHNLSKLEKIQRPILDSRDSIVQDIIFSIPDDSISGIHNFSYGEKGTINFLKKNDLRKIIISGNPSPNGITQFCHGKVISLFSSSNHLNKCGFLFFPFDLKARVHSLPFSDSLKREQANFNPLAKVSTLDQTSYTIRSINQMIFGKNEKTHNRIVRRMTVPMLQKIEPPDPDNSFVRCFSPPARNDIFLPLYPQIENISCDNKHETFHDNT